MKTFLDNALRPVNTSIADLPNTLDTINDSLTEVKASADHANVVANEALVFTTGLQDRVSKLESELATSKTNHFQLLEQTLKLESYSRRSNLKFHGITESKDENCSSEIQGVLEKMDIDIDDLSKLRVHRIGTYSSKQTSPRHIIVKFGNDGDRAIVWAERRELKGSTFWVCEDFPAIIEKRRKKLWPFYPVCPNAAAATDKHYPYGRGKASLNADKLIINNQVHTVDTIDTIPPIFRSIKYTSSRSTDDITLFFTKNSPLFNFHEAGRRSGDPFHSRPYTPETKG